MVMRPEVDVHCLNSTLSAFIFGDSLLLACNLWVWLACELQESSVPSPSPPGLELQVCRWTWAFPLHQTQVLTFVQHLFVTHVVVFTLNNLKYKLR